MPKILEAKHSVTSELETKIRWECIFSDGSSEGDTDWFCYDSLSPPIVPLSKCLSEGSGTHVLKSLENIA